MPDGHGREEPARSHAISDQIVRLTGGNAKMAHPGTLRMVRVWIGEKEGPRTNNLALSPAAIADVYKRRWSIEAFFKLIKQNLRIKSFFGTSANALKIQVYSALTAMVLLRRLQAMSGADWCFSNLLVVVRLCLYLHLDLLYFLNRERPNVPWKRGSPPPARRGVPQNRLF